VTARPLLRGVRGVCACGHPLGAAAAHEALLAGGGAVDAAVAAAFALSVALPEACGLGGEAMVLVAPAGGEPVAFNGAGRAPAALAGPIPPDGGGTVATPAAVAAWLDALALHGRLEPAPVVAPALRLARDGVAVGAPTVAAVAEQRARLERGARGHPLLADGVRPGSRVVQSALAGALERIAAEGARALQEGPLAEAIVRAVQADGGALTLADLAGHRTQRGAPLAGRRLGLDLTVQPPSSQAALVLMALGALERHPAPPGPARTHLAVEALDAAFAHRARLGTPEGAAAALAAPLTLDPERAARRGGARAYAHTTAVAAADAEGTVVSMLVSVFDDFGSALLVPEGGFLLNDRLLGFTEPPNDPAPNKTPVSTLSPVLLDDGGTLLGLATPGADGQVQTLVQVALHLAEGVPLPEALARPRFRAQDGRLLLEADADPEIAEGLAARGHDLELLAPGDARFGAVAAAGADHGTGTLLAATDPRREVWAVAC
jgi:gamma-glutamyltranspeptidase/glutathione hydrolase